MILIEVLDPIRVDLNSIVDKAFQEKLTEIKSIHETYWRQEQSPYGERWRPRQDDEPHPILRQSGRMFRETNFVYRNRELTANTTEYGPGHQTTREWVGLPDEAIELIVEEFVNQFNK